ncbi:phytanoyl-CoA dioxygenase family protein [Hyaloraphidium curvatum]|nr:phytanoyl-CoA dioxygenase family protein [Hyaloraphidium curvatum]
MLPARNSPRDASGLLHRPDFAGPHSVLAEADLAALHRDGCVIIPDLIPPALCDVLKATVRRIGAAESEAGGRGEYGRGRFEGTKTKRVYGLASKTDAFDDLLLNERILAILDRGLFPGYLLHTCQSTEIFPGELAQPYHYDDPWIRTPSRPREPTSINCIWALDDFTPENGATRYHPGSHLWGEGRVPTDADVPKVAEMKKGSVLVFLSTLFHGGGEFPIVEGKKQDSRMGLIFLYCQPWLRIVENWFLMVNPLDLPRIPPKLRGMMGFDLLGLVGNANGLHPMKAIDTATGTVLWNRRSRSGVVGEAERERPDEREEARAEPRL